MKIHDLEFFLAAVRAGRVARADAIVAGAASRPRRDWRAGANRRSAGGMGELAPRREALLAVLAGRSVFDIEELHTLDVLSPAPLRSAVEMAVWDLLGRVLRQPLCNLLGGYYRRRVPVSIRLAGCHPKNIAHVSRELADQGFHTQTIVSSGRPDEDLKNLAAIREMVGDRVELRLDGQRQFDMEAARDLCAGLEFEDLQFFLDPLAAPELHALASLGRQTSVPLAAWRAIRGAGRRADRRALQRGAVRGDRPGAGRAGSCRPGPAPPWPPPPAWFRCSAAGPRWGSPPPPCSTWRPPFPPSPPATKSPPASFATRC